MARTVSTFGILPRGGKKWKEGAEAHDGRIYCCPWDASSVLCIEPDNCSCITIGTLGLMEKKYSGVQLARDGRIFGIPFNSKFVLCIDPLRHEATTFGSLGIGGCKWSGGIMAGDGRIYCTPSGAGARGVLCIDPATNKPSILGEHVDDTG